MNKALHIRITAYILAVFLVLGGFWYRAEKKADRYKQEIENDYSHALYELNAGLNNISLILQKCQYMTNGENFGDTAAKLYSEAAFSKTALSRLPVKGAAPDTVGRFLSQVGNYALSIARNSIKGEGISEEQSKNLALLAGTAGTIAQAVSNTQISMNNHEYWAEELEGKLEEEGIDQNSISASISELEEKLTDFPTLVYDGPFSDHILSREPAMLKGKAEVSDETAHKLVKKAIPQAGHLTYTDIANGSIPVHRFDNEEITVAVSKAGGYLVYLRRNRFVNEEKLTYSQAIAKAKLFLNQIEITNMAESYYFTDNGVCVINFAAVEDDVICYTDLIKVGVALDNGEIVMYEAGGYIYNHKERDFEDVELDIEKASANLSRNLTAVSNRKALIPTDGGGEQLCFEFLCNGADDKEVLIYLDAETFEEADILILLKNDGGTLVK